MEPWRWDGDDLLLLIRVQPRASRSRLEGTREGMLRAALTAPPVDGAANEALRELLADLFGVAKGRVILERGEKSREKLARIQRPERNRAEALLGEQGSGG